MILQLIRIAAVMALVGVAAAIATPKGRLPLALRGVLKTLGKSLPKEAETSVPKWKRALALLLVVAAAALAVV